MDDPLFLDDVNEPNYLPNALNLPSVPLIQNKYIRQILINEPNIDLRYIYFDVLMIDGLTPALDQTGGQPQINTGNSGWESNDIGVLETVGFGRYRALLAPEAVNQIGVIYSRYIGTNTFECFGESIEVIQNYRLPTVFEDSKVPLILSYCNINEAENYFSMRLKSECWTNANSTDKLKALVMATEDIERLAFSGWKTDPRQHLEFPRNGHLHIPINIKKAQCEQAIRYLEGYDQQAEIDTLHITHESFLSTRTTFDRTISEDAKKAGIASEKAWRYLKPFLRDPRLLKIVRAT